MLVEGMNRKFSERARGEIWTTLAEILDKGKAKSRPIWTCQQSAGEDWRSRERRAGWQREA